MSSKRESIPAGQPGKSGIGEPLRPAIGDVQPLPVRVNAATRLREAMKLRGFDSVVGFARALNMSDSALHQQLRRGSLSKADAPRYADLLGVSLEWLLTGRGEPPVPVVDAVKTRGNVARQFFSNLRAAETPPAHASAPSGTEAILDPTNGTGSFAMAEIARTLAALPHDVPVRGTARGDNDGGGDFSFNGDVAGFVRRLPGIASVRDAFALYVQGSSMSPWREEGGIVYVTPHRPARPGDHVVVEMRPTREGDAGTAWLKKLVARGVDGSLVLAQYNPPLDRIKLAAARILRVYRVAEWEELIA